MKKTDVLIIGSSAAGLVAAVTGKKMNKSKSFLVVTKQEKTLIPCGIPYIFGTVGDSDKDILPAEMMFEKAGIDYEIGEVLRIDRNIKRVYLSNDKEIEYEKLVIGTGSLPISPSWLNGKNLENVFSVPKDKVYLDSLQEKLKKTKKVLVIGAGFIGVELSDELRKSGKEVILIEKLSNILSLAFDDDISLRAQKDLKERGVELMAGRGVKEIIGNGKVEGIVLENGEKIDADAVILTMGYKPNSKLAADAGLLISDKGFIKVDEYMRTDDPHIFAVGDCAEKRDFFTRKPCNTMLASTACAEARIAGMNLFKLSAIKTFSGTISIFATALGDTGFGVAGLTEKQAIQENMDIVTGVFEGIDRHPGTLKDTHCQFVKLIVGKESGVILGGEVYGGLSVGELVNTIGIIIQNRMNLNSLITAQIGTHPLLTASPAGYPLQKAAEDAYEKIVFSMAEK